MHIVPEHFIHYNYITLYITLAMVVMAAMLIFVLHVQ